ncbi:MAG: xanthine dehydrogenase family protein [Desulfurococcales archaeon]|nr:xanthine dehydrogenase family protein [Desulfurococcales archaeon]
MTSVEDPYALIEKWLRAKEFLVVGKGVARADALEKALGKAKYVEDYFQSGILFIKQVLSTEPHAKIKSIRADEALKIPKVVRVVTASDIPGENQVGYALPDQPLIAEGKVRFHGELVALVVAEDVDAALEAAEHVRVDYEPLPYVLDPLEALRRKDVLVHEEVGSNIAFRTRIRRGNVEEGFSKADVIVENEYRTHHQEHLYLEPEGALAIPGLDGRLTVITAAQYPHLAQSIIARVLGIPASQIKVVVPYMGGGFGGKDDEGPLTAAKAALVAYLTGKPSFIMYSREESMRLHPKREATIIKYKSGATKDGKLTAIDVTIIHDTGAYANRGPFILWRATVHASGPYHVPNAKVDGYCVYTNKVYQGSFRGFGNPSVQFAAEAQMDELARKLGMDPVEFRLKNMLRPGLTTITNQLLDHSVGIADAVEQLAKVSGWNEKRKQYSSINTGRYRRGIGIGVAWHGISTSRGVPDWSNAYIKIDKDGSVTAFTGIVEMGQGSPTSSHRQIVAEILGAPLEKIKVTFGTSDAPDTGATHASRGTSIGAIGVLVAAAKIRERLNKLASELLNCAPDEVEIKNGKVYVRGNERKSMTWEELIKHAYARGVDLSATGYFFLPKGKFDDTVGQGQAYPAFSYVAMIAEVEVDIETGKVRVLKIWPALAAGKIINPQQVEGQIEGAAVQGMGYVLMEQLVFDEKGRLLNPDLTDYVVPTAMDVPEIAKPVYVEDLFKYGPFGAKGVGEMALIPAPAAIANAVSHALGIRITKLPITPEALYFEIKKHGLIK